MGKIYAEGPYGHESNYFLNYELLLQVAGGIGITPFMAIISDILFRHQLGEVGLPLTVDLIWCVKRRAELGAFRDHFCELLRIHTNFGKQRGSKLQLNVKVFRTGERAAAGPGTFSALSAEMEVPVQVSDVTIELHDQRMRANGTGRAAVEIPIDGERARPKERVNDCSAVSTSPGVDRSGSGSNLGLLAGVIAASAVGMTLMSALFRKYHPNTNVDVELVGWLDVKRFLLELVVGIVGFGGLVVLGWSLASKLSKANSAGRHSSDNNRARRDDDGRELDSGVNKVGFKDITDSLDNDDEPAGHIKESILDHSTIVFGIRPNFIEVMDEVRAQYNADGAEVGVMVCGPETLAETVAAECRSQSFNRMWAAKGSTTQFHYHSVSFNL